MFFGELPVTPIFVDICVNLWSEICAEFPSTMTVGEWEFFPDFPNICLLSLPFCAEYGCEFGYFCYYTVNFGAEIKVIELLFSSMMLWENETVTQKGFKSSLMKQQIFLLCFQMHLITKKMAYIMKVFYEGFYLKR